MVSYVLSQHDEETVRDLLVGRTVKVTEEGNLILDNGKLIEVQPNSGCWSCPSGNFHVETLNDVENVITDVKLLESNEAFSEAHSNADKIYSIFVYTAGFNHNQENRKTLLTIEGSDGNGFYGTGYTLHVTS